MGGYIRKKKKTLILKISIMVLFIFIIYNLIKIINWYRDNKENKRIKDEIANSVNEKDEVNIDIEEQSKKSGKYIVDFNTLEEKNPDIVAWLKVNGTDIEYAIVKAKNNEYYLSHNFYKKSSLAGWIFADYKNKFDGTDKNIVIYGHNMKDNSMFSTLKNVIEKSWYDNKENYDITFITENENSIYKVFSVYEIEEEDYYIQTKFNNNKSYKKFLNTIKNRSIKNFNVDIKEENSILTLSTCANSNKYRIVLHAKKDC